MENNIKNNKSAIYSSILKNGILNFKLEILVYCEPEECIELEQNWIDLLKADYNILRIAGSCLGAIRGEETRAKISASKKGQNNPMFGKTPSEVTCANISASLLGIPKSEETRARMSASKKGKNNPMFGPPQKKYL
jgi:group I intron endonuclease